MAKLVVTASALNLRDAPSTDGNVIAILDRGDVVESIESSSDGHWQKVSHGADIGWASFKYLQPAIDGAPVAAFPWFDIAMKELGITEIAGSGDNPRIVEYLRSTSLGGSMASNDETPWCSAFVNFCVEQAGFAGTDSASARSWLNWGRKTDTPVTGCIVVFERGAPPSGHVAFYVSESADQVNVLGGNQGNKVSFAHYPKTRLLGYRVPK
jgi:uncharacterized protein (TIGR02594 family)